MLINWLVCNSILITGLITSSISAAALHHRCSCPKRNHIDLNDDYNKAVILSPNFPRPYCAKLNCEWWIKAPSNSSVVRFFASKIDTRPKRDYISFYNSVEEKEEDEREEKEGKERSDSIHRCTGRVKSCEFTSTGQLLIVSFKTARGVNDKYGFQASVTLYDNEDDIQNYLSDDEEVLKSHKKSSTWDVFVWLLLLCVIIFIVAALLYWFCKKQRAAEENRSPLLEKSNKSSKSNREDNVREDSIHLSLNSPNDDE